MPRLIEKLRRLPPATAIAIAASHLVLLMAVLLGGLHYVVVQALTAVDMVLVSAAGIPLYRDSAPWKHARDTVTLALMMAFVLLFVFLSFGAAAGATEGKSLELAIDALASIDQRTWLWCIGYGVVHAAILLGLALSSPDPRLAWTRNALAESSTTFLAMFAMIFATIFLARPLVEWLRSAGADIDVSALLAMLMVFLRFLVALVVAAVISAEDLKEIARST